MADQAPPTQNGTPAVIARGISKHFNGLAAADSVDLQVPRGSIFGLIGPSGSGKTTVIRMLTGVYAPDEGEALVLDVHPADFSAAKREAIGYMPQHFAFYPNLTVWENLSFAGSIYGLGFWRHAPLKEQLEFVELQDHAGKLARDLSGGMQRRLSLAAALVHKPELIFLDEPTAGIDPILRHKFWDHFRTLKESGRTLFITTQYVGEAAFCDYVAVLAAGRILAVETPAELRRSAFGGDIVRLRLLDPVPDSALQALHQMDFPDVQVDSLDSRSIMLVAQDGGAAIPRIAEWAHTHQLELETLDREHTPFEDVFVEIVGRRRTDE